jgi:phosphopantetheinyl transferase
VAVVGPDDCRLGVDIELIDRMNADVASTFSPDERELLSGLGPAELGEWLTRAWCAKEAAAKALGTGMMGGPQSLVIRSIDAGTGLVRIGLAGALAGWSEGRADVPGILEATTAREDRLVVAVSCLIPATEEAPR